MNREEQKQILGFVERAVTGDPGSAMAPMDLEADAIIRALFVRNPEAAYRITKLAMTLERELAAARAAASGVVERRLPGFLGRFFARRQTTGARDDPEVPGMEITTNG